MNTVKPKSTLRHSSGFPRIFTGLAIFLTSASLLLAEAPPDSGELFGISGVSDLGKIKIEKAKISFEEKSGTPSIRVDLPAGADYPGINFPCPAGGWNLTGFTGIQIDLTNGGETRIGVALRADNPGDWTKSPWNTEIIYLDPGQTQTLKVTFGVSYSKPGFALDPAQITNIKVFANKVSQDTPLYLGNLKAVK